MTVRLLADRFRNGMRIPAGSVVNLGGATEASLIANKEAVSSTAPIDWFADDRPLLGFDTMAGTMNAGNATVGTQTGGTPVSVRDVETPAGPGVRLTTSGAAGEWARLTWQLPTPMTIRQIVALVQVPAATQTQFDVYVSTDSAFSASTMIWKAQTGMSTKDNALKNGLITPMVFGGGASTTAWNNSGGLNLDTQLFTHIRVRTLPLAGQFADMTVVRLQANPAKRGRVYITADDGYRSWFQYALPLLQARALRCSVAVIADRIGFSDLYMSMADLRSLVRTGHEVVIHGPAGASGSLVDNYATIEQMVADMVAARQTLDQAGLFWRASQKRCYVWPQGKFQLALDDASLLDLAKAADFKVGRTVTRFSPFVAELAAATPHGLLMLPIIGHSRATTAGNEDAEIASIVASIEYAAANGLDCALMFHHVIPTQGVFAATQSIDIEAGRLITILDSIAAQVATGRLECGLLSDLAE